MSQAFGGKKWSCNLWGAALIATTAAKGNLRQKAIRTPDRRTPGLAREVPFAQDTAAGLLWHESFLP